MLKANAHDTYNDGVAVLWAVTPSRLVRGVDFSTTTGLAKGYALQFRSMSMREQDVELADSQGFELSRKIRVRRNAYLKPDMTVVIDGHLHDVSYVDRDATDLYAYLTEIRTDGTLTLLSTTTTTDDDLVEHKTAVEVPVFVRKASTKTSELFAGNQAGLATGGTYVVRTCDYAGERTCYRTKGVTLTVSDAQSAGEWTRLTCNTEVGNG